MPKDKIELHVGILYNQLLFKRNLACLLAVKTSRICLHLPQSSKIKKGSKGDVSELKPTLMAAVPVSVFVTFYSPMSRNCIINFRLALLQALGSVMSYINGQFVLVSKTFFIVQF